MALNARSSLGFLNRLKNSSSWSGLLMIFEGFDGFDDFWGFDSFYSLFDQWVKGEFDDGAWWSRFWLVDDDGAWSAVVVLDDGGLIVGGGLGCV